MVFKVSFSVDIFNLNNHLNIISNKYITNIITKIFIKNDIRLNIKSLLNV